MDTKIKKEERFKCEDGKPAAIRMAQLPDGSFEAAFFVGRGKSQSKQFSFRCTTEARALESFDTLMKMFS